MCIRDRYQRRVRGCPVQHHSRACSMKWWVPVVVPTVLATIATVYGHAWILSDYLIHPTCCGDVLPSRSSAPAWTKHTVHKVLKQSNLPTPETITFKSHDVAGNPGRESSVAGWLIRSSENRGGVVLVHDAGADARQMAPLVEAWHRYGYNCLLIETQEGGQNGRAYLGMAAEFDVTAAIHTLNDRLGDVGDKLVLMGVGEGGAAALFAAQKNMQVDAVVAAGVHAESDEYMLSRAFQLVTDLKASKTIGQHHTALKVVHSTGFLLLDESWLTPMVATLASHIAVIRSSNWMTWLHGHTDPSKGIHRLQPRGLFLIQGKKDFGTDLSPIHKLYHRSGSCEPKLAHLPDQTSQPLTLAQDSKFENALGRFLQVLDGDTTEH
eukprot:TRINITY_DN3087_c0_g1_i3.p1 TRINITY_DN3087_c0_g1~~TRINITY_DN3087_c0_g1_i3.p1  ORF type:complete len:380 (+),score=102.92 TRINITY_DN3087_c0_g1_i3:187-1326(+)